MTALPLGSRSPPGGGAFEGRDVRRTEPFLTLTVRQAFYPQDGDNVERLLAAADVKMYKDKQAREDSPQQTS